MKLGSEEAIAGPAKGRGGWSKGRVGNAGRETEGPSHLDLIISPRFLLHLHPGDVITNFPRTAGTHSENTDSSEP